MTGIFYDDICLQHDTGASHPERPDRLHAILKLLSEKPIAGIHRNAGSKPVSKDALAAVHTREHIEHVIASCQSFPQNLDADTVVSEKSYQAASVAAGLAIEAVNAVLDKRLANAFCAVRPPGHHAEIDRAMGFCLFNNIAVAAQHMKKTHQLEKIFILDWDVHHGNGTQQAFYTDPGAYFLSLHQWPLYPGTGSPEEKGEGKGRHYNQNVIFSPETKADTYLDTFRSVVDGIFSKYRPEFVLISAGFDAHINDPLAQQMLTEQDFAEMTRFVLKGADAYCNGRVVSLLEGGYHLNALASSVHAHISVMAGEG